MEVTRQFHDVEAQNSPPRQCEPVQPTGLSGYQGQVPLGTPSFCGSPVGSNMFGGAACSNGPQQYYMGSPNVGSTISGNVGNLGTAQCGQCSNRSVPHELFGNAYGQQARSGEHVLNLHGVPHGPLGVSHGFGSVPHGPFPNAHGHGRPPSEQAYTPPESVHMGMNAARVAQALGSQVPQTQPQQVRSAFDMLGKPSPSASRGPPPDQNEVMRQLINAMSGDRKSIPIWNGQPATLRSWLKLLGFWEQETSTPVNRWGLKLYQSFSEGSAPRRIADTIPTELILTENGYSLILGALMQKYKPYLELAGPAAIDTFFYSGDRQKGETFSSFVASKEIQRQDMQQQLGETVSDLVCGRVLLKQAYLTDLQRELLSLKSHALLTFDQVAAMLRTLDRSEVLAKSSFGSSTSGVKVLFQTDENPENSENYDEEFEEDDDYSEDESVEDGYYVFEDKKEFQEHGAIYVQAYNDVRRDLRERRKERGFVRHCKNVPGGKGKSRPQASKRGQPQGRGRGRSDRSGGRRGNYTKGTASELAARVRCFNCQELGHYAADCPLAKKGDAKTFVSSRGGGRTEVTTTMVTSRKIWSSINLQNFEAIIDTGAEDAVIGSSYLEQLTEELLQNGLRPVRVQAKQIPCMGVGGEATVMGSVDVPCAIAGLHGVIRFTILKDHEEFKTPPLLPISYLEGIGAELNFQNDVLKTRWNHTAAMRRLPSGHRAVDILAFSGAWNLPAVHRQRDGVDPFSIDTEPLVLATVSQSEGQVRDTGPYILRARSYEPHYRQPGQALPAADVEGMRVWIRQANGFYHLYAVLPGKHDRMIVPSALIDPNQDSLGYLLHKVRITCLLFGDGSHDNVIDNWTEDYPSPVPQNSWTGHTIFVEKLVGAQRTSKPFNPTGMMPGAAEGDKDLAFHFDQLVSLWLEGTPLPLNRPDLPPAPAYMVRTPGVFNFWGSGCGCHGNENVQNNQIHEPNTPECRTMMRSSAMQSGPSASVSMNQSGSLTSAEWFRMDEDDDDETVDIECTTWGDELDLTRHQQPISSRMACARRNSDAAQKSNRLAWSRDMLKRSLVFASRFLGLGSYGKPPEQGGTDGGNLVRGRPAPPEEEDRAAEADVGLEATHLDPAPDDLHRSQPDGHRLHREACGRERSDYGRARVSKVQVPRQGEDEPEQVQGQLDQPRDRQATESIRSSETLELRGQELQPSSRVPSLSSQSSLEMVGMSSMRRTLGKDRKLTRFLINDGDRSGTSSSSIIEGSQDRQELSTVLTSTSVPATAGEHPAGERLHREGCDEARGHQGCGESRDYTNDRSFEDTTNENQSKPIRDEEVNQRPSTRPTTQEEDHRGDPADASGVYTIRRLLGGRSDGGSNHAAGQFPLRNAMLSVEQLGSTGRKVKNAFSSKGIVAKVFMVLCTAGIMANSGTMHQQPVPDFTWLGTQPFSSGSPDGPLVSPDGHFAHGQFVVDEVDLVRQSAIDLEAYDIKTIPRKVKRALAASFGKGFNQNKQKSRCNQDNFKFKDGIPEHGEVDVMEIYSQPRVSARASRHGLKPGGSLDLSTGWDLSRPDHQAKALKLIRELRPALVILSPPCTAFSAMRRLSTFKRSAGRSC